MFHNSWALLCASEVDCQWAASTSAYGCPFGETVVRVSGTKSLDAEPTMTKVLKLKSTTHGLVSPREFRKDRRWKWIEKLREIPSFDKLWRHKKWIGHQSLGHIPVWMSQMWVQYPLVPPRILSKWAVRESLAQNPHKRSTRPFFPIKTFKSVEIYWHERVLTVHCICDNNACIVLQIFAKFNLYVSSI